MASQKSVGLCACAVLRIIEEEGPLTKEEAVGHGANAKVLRRLWFNGLLRRANKYSDKPDGFELSIRGRSKLGEVKGRVLWLRPEIRRELQKGKWE